MAVAEGCDAATFEVQSWRLCDRVGATSGWTISMSRSTTLTLRSSIRSSLQLCRIASMIAPQTLRRRTLRRPPWHYLKALAGETRPPVGRSARAGPGPTLGFKRDDSRETRPAGGPTLGALAQSGVRAAAARTRDRPTGRPLL